MRPNYSELAFIIILGALQPVIELLLGLQVAARYNVVAVFSVLTYVIYRVVQSKGDIFRQWGFRLDNFRHCLFPYLFFTISASMGIYGLGWYLGNTPLPTGFWYVLALYPIWGLAQQFAVQNFIARNLETAVPSLTLRSLLTALLFCLAHFPSIPLVLLTFAAGFVFTYLYHSYKNLLVLGIAHGILGALVFHLILGQDQWNILVQYFS